MEFFDLKKSLKEEPRPIYYLHGDDAYLLSRSVELIREAYCGNFDLNYAQYDLEKPQPDYITMLTAALNSPTFLTGRRVVYAKNLSVSSKDFDKHLLTYFNNPNPESIFIITAGEKNTVDFKKHKNVCAVDCKKASEAMLIKYIASEFERHGAKISMPAAQRICSLTLRDFYRVKTETDKLIAYAISGKEIDVSTVDDTVAPDAEYKLWEFADAASKKDFEKTLKVLAELKEKGTGTGTFIFRLYSMYKNLFVISVSDKSDAELAAELKIKEYAVKMLRRQATKYTKKQLRMAVENLAETDSRIKRGCAGESSAFIAALARAIYN